MIYTIFTSLIITFEVMCLFFYIFINVKSKKIITLEAIWYFVPVFVVMYALYCVGLCYNAEINNSSLTFFDFFNLIKNSTEVFEGNVALDSVEGLMAYNVLYNVAFLVGALLAILTLVSVVGGLIGYFLINKIRCKKFLKDGCDILIGQSEDNDTYLKSHENTILWVDYPLTSDDKKVFRQQNVTYLESEFCASQLEKLLSSDKAKEFHLITLDGKDSNLTYIAEFKRFIDQKETKNVFLYVKLDYENFITINNKILENPKYASYISCFNKYELIARKFVENYPITRFMPNEFFDFDLSCVRNDVTINTFFLGFGKVNNAIYRASVMNDQIPTIMGEKHGGDVNHLLVNYYAFDSVEKKDQNKNANYYAQRFYLEHQKFESNEYFEVPDKICNFNFINSSLDLLEGFNLFKEKAFGGDKIYNNVIVSYGDDVSNVDYAIKIAMLFKQNDFENYHIFIRVRNYRKEYDEFFNGKATFFGYDDGIINHTVIVDENLILKAKSVNASYEAKSKAISKWASLSAIKKMSNIYSGLNVRLKLNLLGYDLEQNNGTNFSKDVLDEVKAKLIEGAPNEKSTYTDYFFFDKDVISPANVLAYQEKLRWNSFYINNGYVPMKKSDIVIKPDGTEDGFLYKDDDDKRLHACITTAKGLDEYHRLIATLRSDYTGRDFNECLEEMQTYKYDYSFGSVIDGFSVNDKLVVVRKV